MSEDPYAAPERPLATEPTGASDPGAAVAILAVLGLASVMGAAIAGANAGAVTFPTIDRAGAARVPDVGDSLSAVAWLLVTVLASSGMAPVRGRASAVVARLGLGLCGAAVAISAWVGASLWASLPFAAEGCYGGECWTSSAVGWSNSAPFVLTGLIMIAVAVFCRNAWVRRIAPVVALLVLVGGYVFLWDAYLFDFLSGPAPQWFIDYRGR